MSILKSDLDNGYDHIVMARCKSIKRAEAVYKVYEKYQEFSPVIVYSSMSKSSVILNEIKEKNIELLSVSIC